MPNISIHFIPLKYLLNLLLLEAINYLTTKHVVMNLKFYISLALSFCAFFLVQVAEAQDVNLALSKTATASSLETPSFVANWVVDGVGQDNEDGNPGDGKARNGSGVEYGRWSSEYSDPQWISIDLGARYEVKNVKLYWEVANGEDFTIDVSDDGSSWTTVATVTGNPATTYYNNINISPSVGARYVRMHGTNRTTGWGYSLYEFEIWGPNSILPIVLNDFKAVKKSGTVQLTWNASMDAESRFNIQRSSNGVDFNTIGKLYYPTGTNGITNSYGFVDESPLAGLNYYRIEYTETGEKTLYSDLRTVRFSADQQFRVSPNPVEAGVIRVELDNTRDAALTVRLLSLSGKMVDQQRINANGGTLELKLKKHLSAGTYILQVLENDRPVRSAKIMVNR